MNEDLMNATTALTPAQPRKFNHQPLLAPLRKAGRTAKRALDGAAWGAAGGGLAGALLGMAFFAWSLNTPFGKFFDQAVSALILLVVVSTLGGLSVLAFALLRAGLRWLVTRQQRPLHWMAALPHFIAWLVPLPLVFAAGGFALAGQLYTWFPRAILYLLTLQGFNMPILLIEAALGMLAGIVLVFRPQRGIVRILAFLPAAATKTI
jgi:hypothetical protein